MTLVYLPPEKCFTLSVELRLDRTRNLCIPHLPGTSPDQAARRGQLDLLNVWKTYHLAQMRWSESALDHASKNGHLHVLEFWMENNLKPLYTYHAMDWASGNGHLDVLEWWRKSGLKLRYTKAALRWAQKNEHHDVVKWWDEVTASPGGLKKREGGRDRPRQSKSKGQRQAAAEW
ncbi:hypothetical protein HDU87_004640 [Geranomyces variabilis]|uniref:Ankyrin repeat protein n=1 Tax=Geranomyces variabilis TaxID=109894 RepID=A0AAD5TIL3_9FUNG|nr:hypothetical protein HDU87_004640 [Geranomyces variabilis]